jgi:hypothetical protein
LSQNNVAKEAGVDPSALRRSRFPELVTEIKTWIETTKEDDIQKSPRQMMLAQRTRSRELRERIKSLEEQRDEAFSKLVYAQSIIVSLTSENERLRSQFSSASIHKLEK